MKHVCANCNIHWNLEDLKPVQDLFQRIESGGVVPSGECPECGALCYPEKKREFVLYCDNPDCKHSKAGKCDMSAVSLKRGYREGRESVMVCLSFDDVTWS